MYSRRAFILLFLVVGTVQKCNKILLFLKVEQWQPEPSISGDEGRLGYWLKFAKSNVIIGRERSKSAEIANV